MVTLEFQGVAFGAGAPRSTLSTNTTQPGAPGAPANSSVVAPVLPGVPLPPGTVNYTVAPQVSTVADGALQPRLVKTNRSYVYLTAAGNYSFPRATPHIMAYNGTHGEPQVSASTFLVQTGGLLLPTNPRVVAASNYSFVVEYNVTIDPYSIIEAMVRINVSFSAYRPPKISAKFLEPTPVPSFSFNLVWVVLPTIYYLGIAPSQTQDIRSLWRLQGVPGVNLNAQLGDSPDPAGWSRPIRMAWGMQGPGFSRQDPWTCPGSVGGTAYRSSSRAAWIP